MRTAMNLGEATAYVTQILEIIARVGLLVLILAAIAGHFGWRPPILPRLGGQDLLYLCGAWLAYRWRS